MSVRFRIHPDLGLVHVVYEGFARLADTSEAFRAYMRHPDFKPGQKHLVDLSRITGYEKDYPKFIALQAHKAEAYVSRAQSLIVYLAPTDEGLTLANLAAQSWENVGEVVTVVQRNEADALAILGLRETRIAELDAQIAYSASPRLIDTRSRFGPNSIVY